MSVQEGDLVVTGDRYYGIVLDVKERVVFLSNGLQEVLSELQWEQLQPVGLMYDESGPPNASFIELARSFRHGGFNSKHFLLFPGILFEKLFYVFLVKWL